jgi:hypothetical protein
MMQRTKIDSGYKPSRVYGTGYAALSPRHWGLATSSQLQSVSDEIVRIKYQYKLPSYQGASVGYRLLSVQKGANAAKAELDKIRGSGKP